MTKKNDTYVEEQPKTNRMLEIDLISRVMQQQPISLFNQVKN